MSGFENHTVYHEVGRRADKRADAAENSRVGQGNEQFRCRNLHLLSPALAKMTTTGVLLRKAEMKLMDGSILSWAFARDAFF